MRTNQKLKDFYDGVYKKGERDHYTYFRLQKGDLPEEFRAVLEAMDWTDKTVLDVGCGTGDMCSLVAESGAKSVTGVDYAPEAISEAEKKYQAENLQFVCDDVRAIEGTFDVIISLGTLEHMDDPLEMLHYLKSKLNDGGSLIVTSPNWTNARGYVLQTLLRLFEAPITLADIPYVTPQNFMEWEKELGMQLESKTVDHNWGQGPKMIEDFQRRLPNVIRDAKMNVSQKQIDDLLQWLEKYSVPFQDEQKHSGAVGMYHFKN